MFNSNSCGNARVNGHVPGLAGGRDSKGNQRKRKGRLSTDLHATYPGHQIGSSGIPQRLAESPRSNSSNGQLKFADRLKGLQGLLIGNGDVYGNRGDQSDLNDIEDPYAFNEPEPVRRCSSSNLSMKTATKPSGRSIMKKKIEKGSNSSTEPVGLNMTRLYPAFFEPSSPQLKTLTTSSNSNKTTLASLLESSIPDDKLPKRIDLDRTFSSFSTKEMNCFPNLTSPPPPEQSSPSHTTSSKVSPVKHGMPSTPQRESNKLAALFSPTYPNSIRNDKTKPRRISTPKNQVREKNSSRNTICDKKSARDTAPKAMASPASDPKKQDDASKTTLNRLQDKIARKMVMGKHQRKMASKSGADVPQRRHSTNDLPIMKERSLLEEQLLGHKVSKSVKREDLNLSSGLTPPPSATTRVPGMNGPLTYGISKPIPNSSRSSGNSSRQQKPHATYGSQKSAKTPLSLPSTRPTSALYGPTKTNTLLRHDLNGSPTSMPRVQIKNEINRPYKRPRTKLDITGDALKHESLQRIHANKESKYDVFSRTNVAETDSDDSDLEGGLVYQKHWFSGWTEAGSGLASEERREGRLSQLRAELRRKLSQVWGARRDPGASPLPKCIVNAALTKPSQTALLLSPKQRWRRTGRSKLSMLVTKQCVFGKQGEGEECNAPALPCAHHCVRHITYNVEQLLFEHCTAKFSDNTQCCVPVFDSSHELPLCSEHARKLDDYNRLSQVLKPKRVRKKSKPSAMTRSTKRNKKKKQKTSHSSQPLPSLALPPIPDVSEGQPQIQAQARLQRSQSLPINSAPPQDDGEHLAEANHVLETATSPTNTSEIYVTDEAFVKLNQPEINVAELRVPEINGASETIVDVSGVDVEEDEALELAVELTASGETFETLGQQEAALLEEHDITNVLNEMPTIAFTDLFGEDKTREPTREETEELERALAAVDKDVKSLQTMGSQILLDYKAQDLMQTSQAQAQVFLEVDKLSPSPGLLDIDKLQAQGLFDEKNAQGLLDNFLDDQALVQTLTSQLPSDLPGSSTGLVYYHNGYVVSGGGMEKNMCAASSSSASMYQTPGMVGVPLPTQTDLHS